MMMVAPSDVNDWMDDLDAEELGLTGHSGSSRSQVRERNSLSKFNTAQRFARKSSRKSGGPSGPRRKLMKRSGL